VPGKTVQMMPPLVYLNCMDLRFK